MTVFPRRATVRRRKQHPDCSRGRMIFAFVAILGPSNGYDGFSTRQVDVVCAWFSRRFHDVDDVALEQIDFQDLNARPVAVLSREAQIAAPEHPPLKKLIPALRAARIIPSPVR